MYSAWQAKGEYATGEDWLPEDITGPIKPVFWNKRRIYITDSSGDHLTLDLDPPADGTYGQVLDHSHEVGPTPLQPLNLRTIGDVMGAFTPTQGRYLAFIHAYTALHGYPPAESEIAKAMCVSPPSVNQMVKMLEKKGLILRQPGQPRSLRILIPEDQIPAWNRRTSARSPAPAESAAPRETAPTRAAPPASLYVFTVFLTGGPTSEKFANKVISRTIEIRGDQTLEQLHDAIFQAYDRWDQHLYEFQFGKRPFDPDGPNYGVPDGPPGKKGTGDARATKLDDLGLKPGRVFGYWFDFGDDWFHQVQVERVEQAIPTVTYPRVIKRTGKSPPQYLDE